MNERKKEDRQIDRQIYRQINRYRCQMHMYIICTRKKINRRMNDTKRNFAGLLLLTTYTEKNKKKQNFFQNERPSTILQKFVNCVICCAYVQLSFQVADQPGPVSEFVAKTLASSKGPKILRQHIKPPSEHPVLQPDDWLTLHQANEPVQEIM